MKKLLLLLSVATVFFLVVACQGSSERDKPLVMTSLFPQYDITRAIAGNHVEIEYLLPPGTNAHSFEPSARTVARILSADALIYTGAQMEPWVQTLIASNSKESLSIMNLSLNARLIDHHGNIYEPTESGHDFDMSSFDPHIWQDPLNVIQMAHDITDLLITLVPAQEETFIENKETYILEIEQIHLAFEDLVQNSELNVMMHGGHNAFGYFNARYNLRYINPYRGFSTDAEPTPQAIANMIDTMNEYGIEYLFSEQLISPNVSNALSEGTGAEILYLYAGGNAPIDAFNEGITLIDMFERNLEQLKIGLRYYGS